MSKLVSSLLIILLGALIMSALIFLQGKPIPEPGEYKYSLMLRSNFTWVAILVQVIAGFLLGYWLTYNPFFIGICLLFIFPFTAILESIYYRGSHNLIPFEFVVYFLYSLPATSAAFLGKFLAKRQLLSTKH